MRRSGNMIGSLRALAGAMLTAAAASGQSLTMSDVRILDGGEVEVVVSGSEDAPYRLEVSSDFSLGPSSWVPLLTAGAEAAGSHVDGAASFLPERLYRAAVADPDAMTGDHIATEAGEVLVHPLVHASFLMLWKGLAIYNDPDSPANYNGLPPADLILVSHGHGDHFDSAAIAQVLQEDTVIVAPRPVYTGMSEDLRNRTMILSNGATQQVHGVSIVAVPAYNGNHPLGSGNGYLLEIGGTMIYISGDTGDIAEMRALEGVDVAFVCMNVLFTMNVDQAASAIREFQPAVVYPYHYRNSDGSFADFDRLKALIGTDLQIDVRLRDWY